MKSLSSPRAYRPENALVIAVVTNSGEASAARWVGLRCRPPRRAGTTYRSARQPHPVARAAATSVAVLSPPATIRGRSPPRRSRLQLLQGRRVRLRRRVERPAVSPAVGPLHAQQISATLDSGQRLGHGRHGDRGGDPAGPEPVERTHVRGAERERHQGRLLLEDHLDLVRPAVIVRMRRADASVVASRFGCHDVLVASDLRRVRRRRLGHEEVDAERLRRQLSGSAGSRSRTVRQCDSRRPGIQARRHC